MRGGELIKHTRFVGGNSPLRLLMREVGTRVSDIAMMLSNTLHRFLAPLAPSFLAKSLLVSHQAIVDQVGVGHATVERWLAAGAFASRKSRVSKRAILIPHLPFFSSVRSRGATP